METLQATKATEVAEAKQVTPSKIMEVGLAFMASKTLLTAVNMELFTHLAAGQLSGQEIQIELGLNERGLYDFLDSLVALGFLKRSGVKESSKYSNTEETDFFLDKYKKSYIGGILQMANNRLYGFWNDLEEALKTGLPQNEVKIAGKDVFEELYANEERLREFVNAMSGVQMGNFMAFAHKFDFSGYSTLCDIGGAGALLSAQIAMNNEHMMCVSYDLPPVSALARENIKNMGLDDRVIIQSGDFFKENLPKADIITMGNILHDWGLQEKKMLIKKAYNALPKGGVLVVIENIIDDNRSKNAFGLMMSLNMLIETPGGFDYTAADIQGWVKEAGFKETSVMPLTGPSSAFIAVK
jgi:precorrin-6B methylase 2